MLSKNLISVKYQHRFIQKLKKSKSKEDRKIVIRLLDDLLENFVRIAAKNQGFSKTTTDLYELIDFLKKKGVSIDYELDLKTLRRLRNDVRYYGFIPTTEDLNDYYEIVTKQLDGLLSELFEVKLEDISLADLVLDESIKIKIKEAENLIEEGKYNLGFKVLYNIAFEVEKETVEKLAMVILREEFWNVSEFEESILKLIRIQVLGSDSVIGMMKLEKLNTWISTRPLSDFSGLTIKRTKRKMKEEDIRWTLDFVINLVLHIEKLHESYLDIDRIFKSL